MIHRQRWQTWLHGIFGGQARSGHEPDKALRLVFICLIVFGLLVLSSAGFVLGYEKFNDPYFFLKRQMFQGVIVGGILFLVTYSVYYKTWREYALKALVITIILLVLVFIPGLGKTVHDSTSWISIFGFSLQPTEFVKLTFLIYLATWFEGRRVHEIKDFNAGLKPFIVVLLIVSGLILAQPDLGTLSILIALSLAVYFVAGASIAHLVGLGAVGVSAFWGLVLVAPYRMNRIRAFMNPDLDPLNVGYHINQALIAIGSGGLIGVGLGQSRQKFSYLPEAPSDSIFAIIGEEMGFFVSIIVIVAFIFIAYRGYMIAKKTPDLFGKFVAVGITTWIVIQACMNIGAMVGLLPFTGVTLPFISYGSSSLAATMCAMGILLNISRHTK